MGFAASRASTGVQGAGAVTSSWGLFAPRREAPPAPAGWRSRPGDVKISVCLPSGTHLEYQLWGSPALSSIPKPPAGLQVPCPDPNIPGKKPSGGALCLESFPGDLQ